MSEEMMLDAVVEALRAFVERAREEDLGIAHDLLAEVLDAHGLYISGVNARPSAEEIALMDRHVQERCGYTVIDAAGEEQPCDHPAPGWRWYQDVRDHGDSLEPACSVHMNEGGERIHAAESRMVALSGLLRGMARRASELREEAASMHAACSDAVSDARDVLADLTLVDRKVAAVRTLADQMDEDAVGITGTESRHLKSAAAALRAALDGPAEEQS